MLNSVNLQGRLAQAPELRYTPGGVPVVRFDLAVEVPSKDKEVPPDYIPVICWREQAEFVARHLTKGRQIVIEGRLTTSKWTDKNGNARKNVEVTAHRIHFAGNKEQAGVGQQAQPAGQPPADMGQAPPPPPYNDYDPYGDLDGLPFV